MLIAFLLLLACLAIMVTTTFRFPERLKDEARPLVWEDWREPLRGRCGTGLSDYRVVSALIFAVFVVLYLVFR